MTFAALWRGLNRNRVIEREPDVARAGNRWRSYARTHVGRVRTVNEDRLLDRADRGLWAIADGMGGHAAGDAAAETVIGALQVLAGHPYPLTDEAIGAVLLNAAATIQARSDGARRVSGSTVVALSMSEHGATILWAGDSRAYRLRQGALTQLTSDHSFVQELIDAGAIAAHEAEAHPQAHVITRALGATDDVILDIVHTDVLAGDVYLLCSDGLSRTIVADDLGDALHMIGSSAADTLLRMALTAGGADNISLVVIEVGANG